MRTNHTTFRDSTIGLTIGIGTVLFWCIIFIFCALFSSCTSKSGQLTIIEPEKVVILDSAPTQNNYRDVISTQYKVKRIEKGVVTWINIMGRAKYERNDTIYYRFLPNQ